MEAELPCAVSARSELSNAVRYTRRNTLTRYGDHPIRPVIHKISVLDIPSEQRRVDRAHSK